MGAGHGHDHLNESTKRSTLLLVLGLTSTFMGVEAIAGWLTGSLALLADAGHMLADVAALSLSMFAMWMATKKSPADKTYGYHRVEILAAAINAVVLLLLVCFIFYEAFLRFSHPSSVVGLPVLIVGTVGLGVNLLSLRLLTGKSTASLNVRSAYLEVLSDAVTSVGVIVGGAVIWTTGWYMIDPLISIGITLFIIWRTWLLLSQAVNVLMEGVPSHLNAKDIGDTLASVTGVKEVHDLHIWSITSGRDALSAHIIVPSGEDRDSVLRNLQQLLQERFHIDHVTLQMMEQRSERIQPDGRIRSDNNKSSVVREGSDG